MLPSAFPNFTLLAIDVEESKESSANNAIRQVSALNVSTQTTSSQDTPACSPAQLHTSLELHIRPVSPPALKAHLLIWLLNSAFNVPHPAKLALRSFPV